MKGATNALPPVSKPWGLIGYALIVAVALAFDLLTDRSFGAFMLSVLPISIIAGVCFVAGPWLRTDRQSAALRIWMIGAVLVLSITLLFSSLGGEQVKTGELILTYAVLAMAVPSSFVIPFAVTLAGPWLTEHALLRIVYMWAVCVGAGLVQWYVLCWLHRIIKKRRPTDIA